MWYLMWCNGNFPTSCMKYSCKKVMWNLLKSPVWFLNLGFTKLFLVDDSFCEGVFGAFLRYLAASLAKSHQPCPTLCDCINCRPPGFSVHGVLQQEYWSGLPCPSPGDLLHPGIEPTSLTSHALAGRFFIPSATYLLVIISTLASCDNTLATWCEELTHWKRHWCWKRLKVKEGSNRGSDG